MSSDHGEMYKPVFVALGLKKREVRVMRALMLLKSARASDIAAECALPRQTAYSILKKLIGHGLVIGSSRGWYRTFSCDYGQLVRFVEGERRKLQRIRDALTSGNSVPTETERHSSPLPAVTYFEGSLGLKLLFDNILDTYKRGKHKLFRGYGINFFAKTWGLEDYIRYFVKKRFGYGVQTKLIVAKGPDDFRITDESTRYGRAIKHLDTDEQNAGVYLVGSKVYLFSFKDNVGVMVENQSIAQFLEVAFDDHWAKTKS